AAALLDDVNQLAWRQGPSCPGNMGQDRRARRAKFGTARPCRVATLGKGREASGARPQPETARERTRMYVTEPETARTKRRAAYRPAPLIARLSIAVHLCRSECDSDRRVHMSLKTVGRVNSPEAASVQCGRAALPA